MNLHEKLRNYHQKLFDQYEIDKTTGRLKNHPGLKFMTLPYIGSRYGQSTKILIAGLDIGGDEKPGAIQSFEERNRAIEKKNIAKHNPHIAGTYFTALYFLKDALGWKEEWNRAKFSKTCKQALQAKAGFPAANPLSYIALTNYYKFVDEDRKNRTGSANRKNIDKNFDNDFFIGEIEIFKPDMIIFQSFDFKKTKFKNMINELSKKDFEIFIGPHPSWRGRKSMSDIERKKMRQPDFFVRQILPWE